ncbi:hypothetical protein RA8P2_00185 (plasmid) [Variovorax sp. RA8]|nr:hypothetical protein RA8P2_00185 [Variovorax sp. RA8]
MESDPLFLAAVVGMPAIALFSSLFVGKAVTSPPPGSWFYRADNYSDAWGYVRCRTDAEKVFGYTDRLTGLRHRQANS